MKKILAFLLSLILLVGCAACAFAAYDVNTAKESVVRIVTYFTVTDPNYPELMGLSSYATGSGFAIGEVDSKDIRYVATAAHVVMHNIESGDVNMETIGVDLGDQYVYLQVHLDDIHVLITDISGYVRANVEVFSPRADVAILKLNDVIPRKAAVVYDRKDFEINEQLTAMGFPGASENNLATEITDQMVATTEKVSTNTGNFTNWDGHASTRLGDQITTTAEMSGGISGGPLVDKEGYVVGVCVSGSARRQNVNYAVAADELIMLMQTVTELKYTKAPLQQGLSMTTLIIIAVAALLATLLIVLIILSATKGKKNLRTLVMGGSMAGKSIQLKKGVPVVIGRDPNRCQIVYPKDTAGVSSVHCTITFDGAQVTVADNGSSYGTFVGGTKVEPGKPMVMHRGQEVTFGSEKNSAELH